MTNTADHSRSVLMVLEATFPVRGGGGAEGQVLTVGRCLLDRGVQVKVVVPMVAGGPQVARESVNGLEVVRIRYPKIRLVGGIIMLAKLAWLLFARRRDYAIIHVHIANNMAAVCSVVGVGLGKRVLVKLTGMKEMADGILDAQPNLATRLKKIAIRRATLLQATSARIRQMLIDRGFDASRILLLPNGVDVNRFLQSERDDTLRRELCGDVQLVGVFVGRLAPEKGHKTLLEAWAKVFAGRSDVKLVLIGDGMLRESLHTLAERLNIGAQVVFTGHSDSVVRYLAIADFGLLTSQSEGLSNSLLEYMAAGLPVIGSKVSGTEDFVETGETGWLFEPGEIDGLARCLAAVAAVGAPALKRMGEQARQRIVSTASLEVVTRELINRYGFEPAFRVRVPGRVNTARK